jgi:crotonobetainyl-CoA:carnitine CoA-transferase CaiB-like acyl-CoA transferase
MLENAPPPTIQLLRGLSNDSRILNGIKVIEMCRIIAGPTITRILAGYGAEVIKITGLGLSDVLFFK